MKIRALLLGVGIGIGIGVEGGHVQAFDVPANDGYYTQLAPILSAEQEAVIEGMLQEEERQSSNQIAILVVESLADDSIEEVANTVFRAWGIGQEDKNNGILILVATADHQMRIEVGYGLEGAVPDIAAKGILDRDIAPPFREGKYYEGLLAGIGALRKHIAGEYTAERYTSEESGVEFLPFFFFFLFVILNFAGAWMARSRSWWAGGVLGGIFGIILTVVWSFWIAIPMFVLLGLSFDYLVSRHGSMYSGRRRGRGFWGGGGWGSGGGFGGFGGGSSGGGGTTGRW